MNFSLEHFFIVGTFMAGVFYLPHCSVMCGPLMFLFKNRGGWYQLGRILGYTAVGTLLGLVGLSLEQAGLLLSLQNGSLYGAGLFMILYGLYSLMPASRKVKTPSWVYAPTRWISGLRSNSPLPDSLSVLLAGALSSLLPCGVLYPVWALAAGAGSPMQGAGVGLSFVLGTIPGLYLIQFVAHRAGDRISLLKSRSVRYAATIILVSTGMFMIVYRAYYAPRMDFSTQGQENAGECHTDTGVAGEANSQSESR